MSFKKVRINEASFEELTSLPGIGHKTAHAILEIRDKYGLIDEETLQSIPHIRISRELLSLVDFYPADERRYQKGPLERITEAINRADLHGPPRDRGTSRSNKSYSYSEYDDEVYDDYEEPTYIRRVPRYQHSNTRAETQAPRSARRIINIPRTLNYDGASNWKAFFMKFIKYAETQGWSGKDCKDALCLCLTGKASEFYANLCDRDGDMEYYDIVRRFEKRFGFTELPETAIVGFNNARQSSTESLHDWADRIVSLATEAFRNLPEDYMWSQAVLRFCHGCADKEAGEIAANARPKSMDQAIDQVKWAIHTHSAMHGKQRTVRQISQDDPQISNVAKPSIVNSRLDQLESKVGDMDKKLERILSKLDFLCKRVERGRSTSPRSRGQVECFACKGNHYRRDCPQLLNQERPKAEIKEQEKLTTEDKKVQFLENADSGDDLEDLNLQGSGEKA